MIGFHFTTYENWKKIRKEGLKPYYLFSNVHRFVFDAPLLRERFNNEDQGIYFFRDPQVGADKKCIVHYQTKFNNAQKGVICLRVNIKKGTRIMRRETGKVKWVLHSWSGKKAKKYTLKPQRVFVSLDPIPPEEIEVFGRYKPVKEI